MFHTKLSNALLKTIWFFSVYDSLNLNYSSTNSSTLMQIWLTVNAWISIAAILSSVHKQTWDFYQFLYWFYIPELTSGAWSHAWMHLIRHALLFRRRPGGFWGIRDSPGAQTLGCWDAWQVQRDQFWLCVLEGDY